MQYIVVHKQPLYIFYELSIPIPMSHPIDSKLDALKWMAERGMQAECTVMPISKFRALSGLLPANTNTRSSHDYL